MSRGNGRIRSWVEKLKKKSKKKQVYPLVFAKESQTLFASLAESNLTHPF